MVNYYEFNKHEYYALIKANSEEDAVKLYVEHVAGNDFQEVKEEGVIDVITKEEAFDKYVTGSFKYDINSSLTTIKDSFESGFDVLLIDGSLL